MKNDLKEQLIKELESQNVSKEELEGFSDILLKISRVLNIERSYAHKMSFLENLRKSLKEEKKFFLPFRILAPALALVLLLFIFIAGVVNAQKSLPGQPLYPVKRLSENIVKAVNPSFKDEIIKRRSEEIKELTNQKKDSDLLKKTINDYKDELKEKGKLNPVKIQETKKNLEEAKDKSGEEDKKEIEKAIIQTEDKIIKEDSKEGENKKGNLEKQGETQIAPVFRKEDEGDNNNEGKDDRKENKDEGNNNEDQGKRR